VLYLADTPRGNAMIDRGLLWNWAMPGGIFVAALVLAGIFFTVLRGGTARTATA